MLLTYLDLCQSGGRECYTATHAWLHWLFDLRFMPNHDFCLDSCFKEKDLILFEYVLINGFCTSVVNARECFQKLAENPFKLVNINWQRI